MIAQEVDGVTVGQVEKVPRLLSHETSPQPRRQPVPQEAQHVRRRIDREMVEHSGQAMRLEKTRNFRCEGRGIRVECAQPGLRRGAVVSAEREMRVRPVRHDPAQFVLWCPQEKLRSGGPVRRIEVPQDAGARTVDQKDPQPMLFHGRAPNFQMRMSTDTAFHAAGP
jgi:hypothetical protein